MGEGAKRTRTSLTETSVWGEADTLFVMSTRAARRAERRRQKARPGARQRSFPWFTALVIAVVVVAGFVLGKQLGWFEPSATGPRIDPGSAPRNVGQQVAAMDAIHIPTSQSFTAYNTTPPSSGPHWAAQGAGPIPWGVYTTTQRDEGVVHNLEHSGVLIAYNGVSDDVVQQLKALRSRYPPGRFGSVKIILEPYPRLTDAKIALTAWGFIDKMDTYDERRIIGFIAAHIEQGPENAP